MNIGGLQCTPPKNRNESHALWGNTFLGIRRCRMREGVREWGGRGIGCAFVSVLLCVSHTRTHIRNSIITSTSGGLRKGSSSEWTETYPQWMLKYAWSPNPSHSSSHFTILATSLPFSINRPFVRTSNAFALLIEPLQQYSHRSAFTSSVHIPFANNQHFCKLNLPNGSRKISRTFLQSSAHFYLFQFYLIFPIVCTAKIL